MKTQAWGTHVASTGYAASFFSCGNSIVSRFHVPWWKCLGTLQLSLFYTAYSCISWAFALYHHKENRLAMSPREDLKDWILTRTAERKTHWPSRQRHSAHIFSARTVNAEMALLFTTLSVWVYAMKPTKARAWLWRLQSKGNPPCCSLWSGRHGSSCVLVTHFSSLSSSALKARFAFMDLCGPSNLDYLWNSPAAARFCIIQ